MLAQKSWPQNFGRNFRVSRGRIRGRDDVHVGAHVKAGGAHVKAGLVQVGFRQSLCYFRKAGRRGGMVGASGRWMLLIKMSRRRRHCGITQTLIRVFVRGHATRTAHSSSRPAILPSSLILFLPPSIAHRSAGPRLVPVWPLSHPGPRHSPSHPDPPTPPTPTH